MEENFNLQTQQTYLFCQPQMAGIIPLSTSCIGTRVRLYLNAPQLSTPTPDDDRISAARAYQRIITAHQRDHGGISISISKSKSNSKSLNTNTNTNTNVVQHSWTSADRARISQRVQDITQQDMASDWQDKLEREAATNWDEFYKTHRTNFFKDRHYMDEEFPELKYIRANATTATLLEAGCGVGNSVFPLLSSIPTLKVYCCDFSPTAIRLMKSAPTLDVNNCVPFVCDLSSKEGGDILREHVITKHALDDHGTGVDLAMMMFCLSAIHPEKMNQAILNVAKVMKKNSILWFRDYAENDGAQLKFSKESRIFQNFYVRRDGTRSYFFTIADLNQRMKTCGLYPKDNDVRIIERIIPNRKTGIDMHRAWIHGRYEKRDEE